MDIILIGGLWLEADAWDRVADELRRRGHDPVAVPLPGVDDRSETATLDDQVEAVLAAVDRGQRPLVVGHSAACTLAWIVADRRPRDIAGVVMIGGFPAAPGAQYAPFFELVDGVMPFPGWEPFAGPDSDDLDETTRNRIAAAAVPVPGGVANATVNLTNPERYEVPIHIICPEFSPDDASSWIDGGEVPELASATGYALWDLDSGHWPMFSEPKALAEMLSEIAGGGG